MVGAGLANIQALELPGDDFETGLMPDKAASAQPEVALKSGLDDQPSLL